MTNPDFDDADFDIKDISNMLSDIDSANLALDSLEGRADRLTASLASLLKAQSQPNPYVNTEAASLDKDDEAPSSASSTAVPTSTASITSLKSTPAPPPSAASSNGSEEAKSE
ncbi:hypothetical protein BGZ96_007770 [Linnemannia gamsii]|uniref:Uncharacterized protein n=1 Tax=Linnemannia gamsii TaxID=64522 RepID=A0ABQ7KES4_9FUNG|nr:hypothetical protein BGZ96_007770 [Linnemannia gamsii]